MCGILCIINKTPITLKYFLEQLLLLQHRGQDSFGYSYLIDEKIKVEHIKGLINNYINYKEIKSSYFLGHTRYITSGSKDINVSQPVNGTFKFGEFIFVFNGNIPLDNNIQDTEYIKNFLIEQSKNFNSIEELLIFFIRSIQRAYSIILFNNDNVYAFKDRYAVRPLSYKLSEEKLIISSEDNDIKNRQKENAKEIEGGEILKFNNFNVTQIYKTTGNTNASCLFEYIYFMNENTIWNDLYVKDIRTKLGEILAKSDHNKFNSKDYIVIGIPNSGIPSGKGYAKYLNLEYKQYITKNKKIQRTFILKNNKERTEMSNKKYIFNSELKNKNIIIVDDSIVRGITLKTLIKNLKEFKVNEIHVRIAAPPIKFSCQYGIDIPNKNNLLVNKYNNNEIIENFNCNSIEFVNIDKIKEIIPHYNKLCTGCFNNNYNSSLEW